MKPIVLIAPGKQLSMEDIQAVIASGLPVMAVANTYELLPCDYCYAADGRWWDHHIERVKAAGTVKRMITCEASAAGKYGADGLEWVEHTSDYAGLPNKGAVTGTSSGEHALILAVNEGFDAPILLGYEYGAAGEGHYFGDHPRGVAAPSNWRTMTADMARTAAKVAGKGIRVVNCTPVTALDCFKRGDLRDVLQERSIVDRPAKTRRPSRQGAVA